MRPARPAILMAPLLALLPLTLALRSSGSTSPAHPPGVGAAVVTGVVTDATSGRPLQSAQVWIAQVSGAGALTAADGRYRILGLPAATPGTEVAVEARLIGYAPARRTVVLAEGENVVDFALQPAVLALDELVVTGHAEAARRTKLGAAVATLQAASVPPSGAILHRARPTHDLPGRYNPDFHTEDYDHLPENPFLAVSSSPLSTFSIDVDRASYANVRRFIRSGQRPPVDAVRIEELVNYFTYEYAEPEGDLPFSVHADVARAPWQPEHRLVRIGLQGRKVAMGDIPPGNLVFLIDVSGSMSSPDKLPLLKTAFRMLVDQLRPRDRVAIVVYAGAAGLVLPSTPGSEKGRILEALDRLEAGGSTAGGEGIRLAYQVARENHVRGGNNRVILATDGDFNVGPSSDSEMVRLIEEKREQGTFLTVLGFGTGNLKDAKMEQIADHGNGNFAYIDNELEARKVLVQEMGGTLLTIAKDVKLQVEFNPTRVAAYRLIGYENRVLATEDFDDDRKDAGELGAGHTVTALYEVIPLGSRSTTPVRGTDSLRYQTRDVKGSAAGTDELLFVKLRYKDPDGSGSRLLAHAVPDRVGELRGDFRFAAAVAAFGMVLRESEHCGEFALGDVVALARGALGADREGYRAEFMELVEAARKTELLATGER